MNDDVEISSRPITKIGVIRNNLASQTMNIALLLRNQITDTEDIIENTFNLQSHLHTYYDYTTYRCALVCTPVSFWYKKLTNQ